MALKKKQREFLKQKYGGKCAYCGCDLPDRWHADHLESVQRKLVLRNGRWVSSNEMWKPENDSMSNMMPSCPPCNISKHSMSLEGWRGWIAGHINSLNNHHPIYRLAKSYGLIVETGKPVKFYFEQFECPQPTMPQPETNCPNPEFFEDSFGLVAGTLPSSKLSAHDQVTRDEFDQEAM